MTDKVLEQLLGSITEPGPGHRSESRAKRVVRINPADVVALDETRMGWDPKQGKWIEVRTPPTHWYTRFPMLVRMKGIIFKLPGF